MFPYFVLPIYIYKYFPVLLGCVSEINVALDYSHRARS